MKKNIHRILFLLIIGILALGLPGLVGPVVMAAPQAQEPEPPPAPVINVWYGTTQRFGEFGNPQGQIGILGHIGNLANPDDPVNPTHYTTSLSYIYDGGDSVTLSMGPDGRRLQDPGDFVVELFDAELVPDAWVVITARNVDPVTGLFSETSEGVRVLYQRTNRTPLPYTISTWPNTTSLYTKAQAVDGYWYRTGSNVRTGFMGYDRLLAIGDMSWQDYEVTADIKPIGIDTANCGPEADLNYDEYYCGPTSGSPGVGLILRWQGHTDNPISNWQPKSGWLPLGAIGWYRWYRPDGASGSVRIYHDEDTSVFAPDSTMGFGQFYTFKMRVETLADGSPQYRLKVWPKDTTEPSNWNVTSIGEATDPRSGSVVLFAHHVDIEVGEVTVTSLGGGQPQAAIVSDDFNVCTWDPNVWEFFTPVNLGVASANALGGFTGDAKLNISIPGNVAVDHRPQVNNNKAARLRQSVDNGNFEVEAKFDSTVSAQIPDARYHGRGRECE
jgi:hypothetical protein